MPTISENKQKRAALIEEGRKLIDKADGESRALSSEENDQYERIHSDIAGLSKTIDAQEKQKDLERSLAGAVEKEQERQEQKGEQRTSADLLMEAARSFVATGSISGEAGEEFRNLQAGVDTEGGYLMMPEQFVAQLIKEVDDMVVVRGLATTFQVPNAVSLGAPSLDQRADDSDWTTELATGSEDTGIKFGKRKLTPHPLAKRVKISNELLRSGIMNPEGIVMSELGYKFGVTQEKAFMTGHGNQQPLGLFTASTNGISTARDVSEDNTTTAITFDGLLSALYSLKSQYQANGQWLFHRDAIKQIAKIKDNDGQYIWRASVVEGRPDLIQGRPVIMSEFVPNTFAADQYVGMFADFSKYWIADAMNLQMQRLGELYAESNQTGFIGRLATDGMPVLEEAFARIQLASA